LCEGVIYNLSKIDSYYSGYIDSGMNCVQAIRARRGTVK